MQKLVYCWFKVCQIRPAAMLESTSKLVLAGFSSRVMVKELLEVLSFSYSLFLRVLPAQPCTEDRGGITDLKIP